MKRVLSLVAALAVSTVATAAFAAGSSTIAGTKHNLSAGSSASYKVATAGGTGQICIFCHTPHNAAQNVPLWNRTANGTAAGGFTLYSSVTMVNSKHATGFTTDSISLFCMSCHDGSALGGTTMIKNQPADGTSTDVSLGGTGASEGIASGRAANLGTDLRSSHPINFRVLQSGTSNGLGDVTGNILKTSTVSGGFPLFASGGQDKYLECGSCHAVHDNTNIPFLRTTNDGSKLCLGCHVK